MRNAQKPKSITGRDEHVSDKALIYAIAHIQRLPKRKQEASDMIDMCRLLRGRHSPQNLALLAIDVEAHIERKVDLYPEADELSYGERGDPGIYLGTWIDEHSKRQSFVTKLAAPVANVKFKKPNKAIISPEFDETIQSKNVISFAEFAKKSRE